MESEFASEPGSLWTGPVDDPRRYRVGLHDEGLTNVGAGGEGLVFQATRVIDGVDTDIALKLLTNVTIADFPALFERGAALEKCSSPYLMRHLETFVGTPLITDQATAEEFDVIFTAAEWIPGMPLSEAISEHGPIQGLAWIAQIALGVADLHAHRGIGVPEGILHRDIKPSNVRVRTGGQAVLIDYGVAKPGGVNDMTSGVGTYLWRAPEVIGGPGVPGRASDAWGVGAVAYWVLVGEPPRLEGFTGAVERLKASTAIRMAPKPDKLSTHIASMLHADPERRPVDLVRWSHELSGLIEATQTWTAFRMTCLAGVGLGLLSAGLWGASSFGSTAPPTKPAPVALVAVGSHGSIVTSGDGKSWKVTRSGTQQDLFAVSAGIKPGSFVAVGSHGVILKSGNGSVWSRGYAGTTADLHSISLSQSGYVAVGSDETILSSVDGDHWIQQVPSTRSHVDLRGVSCVPDGTCIAVGAANTLLISIGANGIWHQLGSSCRYADNNAVSFSSQGVIVGGTPGAAPSICTTNSDGTGGFPAYGDRAAEARLQFGDVPLFTLPLTRPEARLYGIAEFSGFGYSTFVAIGGNGWIFSSSNALSFSQEKSPTSNTLLGISATQNPDTQHSQYPFVVVGRKGTILSGSAHADVWLQRTSPVTSDLNSVVYSSRVPDSPRVPPMRPLRP